eukprot:1162130-Pelagomonas_calceolata.AAC.3
MPSSNATRLNGAGHDCYTCMAQDMKAKMKRHTLEWRRSWHHLGNAPDLWDFWEQSSLFPRSAARTPEGQSKASAATFGRLLAGCLLVGGRSVTYELVWKWCDLCAQLPLAGCLPLRGHSVIYELVWIRFDLCARHLWQAACRWEGAV